MQGAFQDKQPLSSQYPPQAFVHGWLHNGVEQAGLVLNRQEEDPARRLRPLPADDQPARPHQSSVTLLSERIGGECPLRHEGWAQVRDGMSAGGVAEGAVFRLYFLPVGHWRKGRTGDQLVSQSGQVPLPEPGQFTCQPSRGTPVGTGPSGGVTGWQANECAHFGKAFQAFTVEPGPCHKVGNRGEWSGGTGLLKGFAGRRSEPVHLLQSQPDRNVMHCADWLPVCDRFGEDWFQGRRPGTVVHVHWQHAHAVAVGIP